jgi:hypothetical protein
LEPAPLAVSTARRYVGEQLVALGLASAVDDAAVAVSELVANAVMHARTPIVVQVVELPNEARVEVHDDSPRLPVTGLLSTEANSGRGLMLVAAVSHAWGVDPVPGDGKTVWFTVGQDEPPATPEVTAETLLALWGELEDTQPHDVTAVDTIEVVLPDVPVAALLTAKQHVEDLVRELRLILLNDDASGSSGRELQLARSLDEAVADFSAGRIAIRTEAMRAASRSATTATLRLHLPVTAAGDARRYRDALGRADELCSTGRLLVVEALSEHADLRYWYLTQVIDQLEAAA